MDLGLNGRTAVVCGSTSGLGLAIARVLAHEGANVVVSGRRRDAAKREAAQLPRLWAWRWTCPTWTDPRTSSPGLGTTSGR
jgi:NAD(P)-dependent dehydrogenase (short-subunit alcohol dehydrogenase family)